jgi:hypothetical protein
MERQPSIGQEVPLFLSSAGVGEASPLAVPGEPHDAALRAAVGSDRRQVSEKRSFEQIRMAFGQAGTHGVLSVGGWMGLR